MHQVCFIVCQIFSSGSIDNLSETHEQNILLNIQKFEKFENEKDLSQNRTLLLAFPLPFDSFKQNREQSSKRHLVLNHWDVINI